MLIGLARSERNECAIETKYCPPVTAANISTIVDADKSRILRTGVIDDRKAPARRCQESFRCTRGVIDLTLHNASVIETIWKRLCRAGVIDDRTRPVLF